MYELAVGWGAGIPKSTNIIDDWVLLPGGGEIVIGPIQDVPGLPVEHWAAASELSRISGNVYTINIFIDQSLNGPGNPHTPVHTNAVLVV